jgi:hypothetical protein
LTTGRIYRLKYSATNVAGEGPLSPEVQILLAETPSAPVDLRRISIWELPAGSISVKWDLPTDNGGHPITGYTIYLDGLAHFNTTEADSTLSEYVLIALTVDREYEIKVSARNDIGEGTNATITLLAASLAPKPPLPDFESATSSSITVNASVPSYSGGTAITGYAYRRDDGPLTEF